MHQRKWETLVDRIEKLFGFIEHTVDEYPESRMTVETVVFDGASGKMMLERTKKPLVIDQKTSFSKRIGSEVSVEYVLSDDEFVDTVKCYRWDRAVRDWREVDIEDIGR
jgi:hypothetical protein